MLRQQLKEEGDFATINILNDTANEALQMGLIIGHGYHGGKYEILHKTEIVLLSPKEAQAYLQNLIDSGKLLLITVQGAPNGKDQIEIA